MSNWNFSTEIPLSRVRSSGLCALRVAREKLPSDFASSRIFRLARLTLRFLTCKCRASSPCSPVGGTAYASNRANSRREGASYLSDFFSGFLLFRAASLQISDEPDLLHFDVESTNPWPIRENLRTFPTFLPPFLARVRISCFRKTTFTSSPFPCNPLMLSELRVKVPFFVVFWQLLDL